MMKKQLKYAFFTFLGIAAVGLTSGVMYLESESFANSIKRMISERSPQKFGIVGDFSNLKLHFFPPGIGVASPKIHISKDNITQVPMDGDIEAKELRVSFAPIQMFSGILQVSEIQVSGGAIQGTLFTDALSTQTKHKKDVSKLSWQDLFEIQIDGFHLEDTYLNLTTKLPGPNHEEMKTELVVKNLFIKKTRVENRDGFVSSATVNAVRVVPPASLKNLPVHEANQLQWDVEWNDRGLKLNPFTADLSGIRFRLNGMITGNLLDPASDPQLTAEAQVHSDLGTFFLSNLNDDRWGGEVDVKSKISASLKNPVATLKSQFSVQGENLVWKEVKARKISGEGDLDLRQKKIALKSFEVEDQGKLKISSTEIPFQLDEPFRAEVDLENADIHWLGGVVAKEVAPLGGKISGKIRAQFAVEKGKSWRLKTEDDLHVDQFTLATQKHSILKPVLPVKLGGDLEITPKGLDFKEFRVGLNKSQFQVNGGIHADSAGGYALSASGPIDLKEINEIAENEIRGEGDLEVKVHGPSSNVILDFIPKIKEASYLGLHFGAMDGKVTYDDGVSELRFEGIHAHYQNTFYSMDQGFIDLSGEDDLNLPFDIHSGHIEDLAQILEKLTHKISWYPKTLKGEIHGTVLVSGKISTPKMKVVADIEGSDWLWMGERARRVKMSFGVDQGTYFAKNVVITKTSGSVKGDLEFVESTNSMKWNLTTENLSFIDIDFLDRLELPAKSKIEIKSQGDGPLDHLKSKTEARLYGTEFKGEVFEPSHLTLEVGESTLRANINVFGDKLSSQVKYALIPKQPSTFRLDLNEFDFSPALLVLNPKLLDDPDLVGEVSGHIQLDFLSTQAEFARGDIQLKSYRMGKSGFLLSLIDPVSVPVQLGYFHFPASRLKFNNSELTMGGEGKRGDIDFYLKGQTDLAIAELLSSSISKASGKADTDIRLHGPLKSLSVNGDINFSNARMVMKWLQSPFEEMDGSIRIRQGLISIESIDSYLGEEVFSLSGKIQTFTDHFPEIDLRAQFEDNKVKMAPLDLVQVRGVATIKGTEPPYVISGNLEVPQALWTRSFGSSGGSTTTRGDRFLPVDEEKQIANNILKLDLSVNAPQGFTVKNDIIDGEFRGKVKIIGPPDNPKLLGDGQLVQGKILFKDRPFIFENVKVEFDDPFQLNPKFNASAISEVSQYKIRVLAYGRASSWKAEFTSTPFLPESEIFSLLTSGYTTTDANRYKNRDRSYVSQGEAASLILHSMDFSKDVQNKTGFQFDVEEAVDESSANSIFRPSNLADNVASPKLVLKRQLGRNIWFSVGSTVGVGTEKQKEVNAEYKLTQGMSAIGVWNDIEEVNSTGTRTSFGLDLKFNKRFK